MKTLNKKHTVVILASRLCNRAVIIGGLITGLFNINKESNLQKKYNLLAKRILIDNPNDVVINFNNLSKKLNDYSSSNLSGVKSSIYFEYLPTGSFIGVNEDEQLVGASLLKTPLAINLYKATEENKLNLDTKVALKKEWINDQYGELYKKGEGYQISYRELIKLMLKDSDNTAELAVFDILKDIQPIDYFNFVDIDFNINKDDSLQLGASAYSSILKCLYFSCHLDKNHSQEILSYLADSTYDKRLKLYLSDPTLKVAHKYGTFGNKVQSDCGIFYVPNRNYLLCVMLQNDDPLASKQIGDISLIVNKYINNLPSSKN